MRFADVVEQCGPDEIGAMRGGDLDLSGGAKCVVLVHGTLRREQAGRLAMEDRGDVDLITRPGPASPQRPEEATNEVRKAAESHTAARNTQAIHELRNDRESSKTKTRAMSTKNP